MKEIDFEGIELAKAFTNSTRLKIFRLLNSVPGCIAGCILNKVGLAQSIGSEHLLTLKAASVVSGEISVQCTCYAPNSAALELLANFSSLTPHQSARRGLLVEKEKS